MGIINSSRCCCNCEEMFQDFQEGDEVSVGVVSGSGGSRDINGTIVSIGTDSVVIEETGQQTTRVCCAYIVSVSDPQGASE